MMISMKTGISWTHATLNPWVGCVAVSDGCERCYAKRLVDIDRGGVFGHPFEEVKLHLNRLTQMNRFGPIATLHGLLPRMVFVNSVSDFWIDQVPDSAIHAALDTFEQYPRTVLQILTKRPVRARKMLVERYRNRDIPANLWFGVSVEDNRVAGRLNVMRRLKEQTGGNMTLFASIEPIIGPTEAIDFTGVDWVITGGESGPGARVMQKSWLMPALENAAKSGARIWHKQSGSIRSHPNLEQSPASLKITARFEWLVENGWEVLPDEKGGATVDRAIYRDLPLAYDRLKARLNDSLI